MNHFLYSKTLRKYSNFPLMKDAFKTCFKITLEKKAKLNFPCTRPMMNQECEEYCHWHEEYIRNTNFEEFLTLMKFGLPQRKWISEPVGDFERNLAGKLFGESNITKIPVSMKSPVPFAFLCESRMEGFKGDQVGLSKPACNDFFITPTDQGLCMTENLDIKEVLYEYEKYNILMEPSLQKPSKKIQGGTLWSQKTFVISTQNEPYRYDTWSIKLEDEITSHWDIGHCRDKVCKYYSNGEIKLQVHMSRDLGHMLSEPDFIGGTESMLLKRGWEYFINIYPVGSRSSDKFKSLNVEDRQCLNENEVPEDSMFKKYSEKNCKYECHLAMTRDICRCTPWDFVQKRESFKEECDVFGRTCFFDTMKNLSESATKHCPHCLESCDHIEFRKVIMKKQPLPRFNDARANNYLLDFMTNSTFFDPVINNFEIIFDDYPSWYDKNSISRTMIVVHFKYIEPEIDHVDLTFSIWDKFANLGGNFGIFAEITGASLLGMINALILVFKLISAKVKTIKCQKKPKKPTKGKPAKLSK